MDQAQLHLLRPGHPAQQEIQTQFRRQMLLLPLRLLQVKSARAMQVSLILWTCFGSLLPAASTQALPFAHFNLLLLQAPVTRRTQPATTEQVNQTGTLLIFIA